MTDTLVQQVSQDYGYPTELILATVEKLRQHTRADLVEKVMSSDAMLGLCVHSLSTADKDQDQFTVEERVEAIVATTSGSGSKSPHGNGSKLGFRWTAIVEIPMLQKVGRVTFTPDCTFVLMRTALAEFLSSSSPPSAVTATSTSSSLIDDGSLQISVLDDQGWSQDVTSGNFSFVASQIALFQTQSKGKGKGRGAEGSLPCLTITLRSVRDPFGPRARLSELCLITRHNKTMRQKVEQLGPLGYAGWRPIRGDGNCYYRAVMTGFFELVLGGSVGLELAGTAEERQQRQSMQRAIEVLGTLRAAVLSAYGAAAANAHDALLAVLSGPAPRRLSWAAVEAALLSSPELDLALVRAGRCLAALFLVHNEGAVYNGITIRATILALWEDCSSVRAYCDKYVYPLGVDAEGTLADLGVLFRALGCRGVTVLVDAKDAAPGAGEAGAGTGAEEDVHTTAATNDETWTVVNGERPSSSSAGLKKSPSALSVYESGVHESEPASASSSASAPHLFSWLTTMFGGDGDGSGGGAGGSGSGVEGTQQLPLPHVASSGSLGSIHLMLRAGKGMGEGHYDLLYHERAPLLEAFRQQGSKQALLARLPVPPLIVPNHVHSVEVPRALRTSGSLKAGTDDGKKSSTGSRTASTSASASAETASDDSDDSDAEDVLEALGWELVDDSDAASPRSHQPASASASASAPGGKKKKTRLSLRVAKADSNDKDSGAGAENRAVSPSPGILQIVGRGFARFLCFKGPVNS